uniref:Cytochrome c-552/4 domain-containing protein n=1 Tax=Geobacter sp. (strain M21) TaxID=443144 RepID=C6DYQ7_GEOSM
MKAFFGSVVCGLLLTVVPAMASDGKKEFVGSVACKKCHAEEFKSWKGTFHAKIAQTKKAGILKDVVAKWATDGKNPGPTVSNVTGTPAKLEDVEYVIGSRWKQRFLVKNEQTGNLQFLNKQFNRLTGEWENYGNKNDWNTNCGTCHTTGYRITQVDKATGKTLKSEFSEMSVGCEACHGPGMKHVKAARKDKKKTIFNPASVSIREQSKVCGYCHIRLENEMYKTAQGHNREDLPAPKVGDSYKAGEDWTKWYPEHVVIPGVQPNQPFDKEYTGDLKGLFKTDEIAKANRVYDESKHHQQYQGFIQSDHYKKGLLSCITCHSPHAGKGKLRKVAKDACTKCHDASYTVEKYMPNTGKTADNLFVRSHTFAKNPRPGGKGASSMGAPVYYE